MRNEAHYFAAFMAVMLLTLVYAVMFLAKSDEVERHEVECTHAKAVLEFAEGKSEYFPPMEE